MHGYQFKRGKVVVLGRVKERFSNKRHSEYTEKSTLLIRNTFFFLLNDSHINFLIWYLDTQPLPKVLQF